MFYFLLAQVRKKISYCNYSTEYYVVISSNQKDIMREKDMHDFSVKPERLSCPVLLHTGLFHISFGCKEQASLLE